MATNRVGGWRSLVGLLALDLVIRGVIVIDGVTAVATDRFSRMLVQVGGTESARGLLKWYVLFGFLPRFLGT